MLSSGGLKQPDPPDKVEIVYKAGDPSPFRIMIEGIEDDIRAAQKPRINCIQIGKDLKDIGFKKSILDIMNLNRNKAVIYTDNYKIANEIINNAMLKAKYKVTIPEYFLTISGVLSGIPINISEDEILENIKVPFMEVTKVQRLKRKENDELIDTWRVKVTFRANKLPFNVSLFSTITKVRPFFKKMSFCSNCLRYNHTAQFCRSTKRCPNCTSLECQGCESQPKCKFCRANHKTNDEQCPEKSNQKKINKIMSIKNMLYIEARQIAINGSNRYEWLSLLDDPTPAESAASNIKEKRTYAQVTLNNRENLNPRPKPRNIPRKNSIKRSSRNDLTNLDTTNNPVTQVEQLEPKRQKTYDFAPIRITLDPPGSTDCQIPQSIESVQMDTTSSSNTCNLDTPKSQNYRKKLQEEKTEIEKILKQHKELQKQAVEAIAGTKKEIAEIGRKHDTYQLSKEEYNEKFMKLNDILKNQKRAKIRIENDITEQENNKLEIEINLDEDD